MMFSDKSKEIVKNSSLVIKKQRWDFGLFSLLFCVGGFVLCYFRFLLPVCQDLLAQNGCAYLHGFAAI